MPLTAEQQTEINKALEKEVNELDGFYESGEEDLPKDSGDPPVDESTLEDDGDPPSADDTPPEPEPGPEPVPERDPEPPPAEDITDSLRKQINEQNKLIMEMQRRLQAEPAVTPPASPTPAAAPVQATPTPTPSAPKEIEDVDYVSGLDMDDISADPEVFNQILNKVVRNAVAAARIEASNEAVQKTLLAIPQVIQAQIHQQTFITEAVNSFYKENADLQPVKETVAQVAQNIAAEHPEYDITKLFTEAAKVTRTVLKMPEQKGGKPSVDKSKEFRNPAFAARKNSVREVPGTVTKLQAELDEL